ncbi:bacteriohemerythrin [Campylobacter upsaliensis]|uniref:Bacteriohemerythrin n=2 Tax=Campylobacter upsaliensis TaxID=28080 RepID=A0A5L8Z7I5_CAMUP|nr:bacteriohemerythrin [Campylobacter upsaliensis]EDP6856049.1 bacteriohemerythrin [Campylobacter upsaliensis]EEA8806865.1 bacteriohemerythrin [Campylobacter upsaliensis]EGK8074288.1 bacteriohemerythrin [Campylobacter upsaliensis]MEB2830755.1 hemerythrin domain-containing protein [Campylobacter upsaliensis]
MYRLESLTMHNELLDAQHKELYELAKRITHLNSSFVLSKELKPFLRELLSFMNRHFVDEEEFMLQINYPNLSEHKKIHRKIILEIEEIIITEAKILNTMSRKIENVVTDLIFKHTVKEDYKIAQFYEENFLSKGKI